MNLVNATIRNTVITLLLLIAVLFGAGFAFSKWLSWKFWDNSDLGHKPPAQVFQKVFRMPVPAGVSNLKIAGESHLSGVVWMRFQVKDVHATMTAFKKNLTLPAGEREDASLLPSKPEINSDYAKAVGWADVLRIKNPECYQLSPNPPAGWFGILVVDRKRKTIYVHGSLL